MIYDGPTTASLFQADNATTIVNKGFGHVRFFFDPLLCGSNLAGQPGQYVYPSATNITPGMAALIQDIHTANNAGLAVVLNFFPFWISYEHNYRTANGKPDLNPTPQNEWKKNPDSWKRTWNPDEDGDETPDNPFGDPMPYPGPWRKDFAMYYGPVSGINQNHPLPKLWKGITEILQSEGFTPGEVYLQPISEAQTGLSDPKNFGETPSLHNEYVDGSDAFKNRYQRWRKIQLETIQAIWSVNPEYKVLVTSQESFPWSYRNEFTSQGGPGMDGFTSFEPYTREELGEPTENLIYTFHMYSPYEFTHNSWISGDHEQYVNKGAGDNVLGSLSQPDRDDYNPSPPTTNSYHINTGSAYHYNPTLDHFNLMKRWLKGSFPDTEEADESTWAPPLLITEFGGWRKAPGSNAHDPAGVIIRVGPRSGPDYDAIFPLDIQRAKWVYDIRNLAEDNHMGWTYFDYSGGFRAFEGKMFDFNHTNLLREPSQPTDLVYRFTNALFGGTRP